MATNEIAFIFAQWGVSYSIEHQIPDFFSQVLSISRQSKTVCGLISADTQSAFLSYKDASFSADRQLDKKKRKLYI